MSFLRRILGAGSGNDAAAPADPVEPDLDDAQRERQLLRDEAERTSNELMARQLRYAGRSWTPPAQGGERRADDREDGE